MCFGGSFLVVLLLLLGLFMLVRGLCWEHSRIIITLQGRRTTSGKSGCKENTEELNKVLYFVASRFVLPNNKRNVHLAIG